MGIDDKKVNTTFYDVIHLSLLLAVYGLRYLSATQWCCGTVSNDSLWVISFIFNFGERLRG